MFGIHSKHTPQYQRASNRIVYPAVGWLPLRIRAAGAAFSPAMRPLVFLKPTGERSSGRGAPGSIGNLKSARNRSLQLQTPRLRLFLMELFFLGIFTPAQAV